MLVLFSLLAVGVSAIALLLLWPDFGASALILVPLIASCVVLATAAASSGISAITYRDISKFCSRSRVP